MSTEILGQSSPLINNLASTKRRMGADRWLRARADQSDDIGLFARVILARNRRYPRKALLALAHEAVRQGPNRAAAFDLMQRLMAEQDAR